MIAADLPTRRVEAWKYSDLRAALGEAVLPPAAANPPNAWGKLDGVIDRLALGQGAHALTKVRAGESEVLIERLEDASLSASVREIQVLPGASLTRIVVQPASAGVVLNAAHVSLSEAAQYRQLVFCEGAKLARIETHVSVDGEGAQVELNGLYLCGPGRHGDLTSVVDHRVANGQTRQLIKGVAKKGGRGVFQGKIIVAHGAQKTDARQYHHGMLLEDGAEIFAKPELLIHADDVQCAHGNTAGGIDEGALFYLRSRGLPVEQARGLLIEAFLAEAILDGLPDEINDELVGRIHVWLGGAS